MKPRILEHYEITRKLGAGGSGVVYLATDTLLMRPVVLKMLRKGALSIEQMRTTVLREARLASASSIRMSARSTKSANPATKPISSCSMFRASLSTP